MSMRRLAAAIVLLGLSACATIDIADMTTMGGDGASEPVLSSNVVINASEKLYASFEEKGLCLSQEDRMKSAASTLLKGRNAAQNTVSMTYLEKVTSETQIKADIADTTQLIVQAHRAADVYFELAEPGLDLRPELKSLEQALYATQMGRRNFDLALERVGAGHSDALMAYEQALDQLRLLTNHYGDRVRAQGHNSAGSAS